MARRRQQDQAARDLIQVYQAVRIYVVTENNKRMPKLSDLLREARGDSARRQQVREQRLALETLSQQYGIPLRKRPRVH